MKILQLIDSLEAGGAERIAVTYANALSEHIDSHICVTRAEGVLRDTISTEVKYLFLRKKNSLDPKAIFLLLKYIKRNNISIIHAHSSSYFLACLVKLLRPSVKIIWHNHYGDSINLPFKQLFVLKLASYLFSYNIVVNNILGNWAKEQLNCKNVIYIPNFIPNSVNDIQEIFLKGNKGSRIVCLANLRREKDHLNLLAAMRLVLKSHPNWSLHLIGKNFNDDYSLSIANFVEKHNLEKKVFLYGTCIDVNHILAQSNIAVLSSKFEGLPMAILEYGSAELPVIVTDVGECSNIIRHNQNGLLITPENSQELFIAIKQLIENSQLRDELAIQLKNDINNKYTASTVVKSVLEIYKTL